MDPRLPSQTEPPQRAGEREHAQLTPSPGEPDGSGYAEERPNDVDRPNPDAAGNQRAQVAGELPGEEDEQEDETEETPPGENKREPIPDPDPADTKLHVQQASR